MIYIYLVWLHYLDNCSCIYATYRNNTHIPWMDYVRTTPVELRPTYANAAD